MASHGMSGKDMVCLGVVGKQEQPSGKPGGCFLDRSHVVVRFFRRLFGQTCCVEFTQWELHERSVERAPTSREWLYSSATKVTEVYRWQERHCTICGKIQQQKLEW